MEVFSQVYNCQQKKKKKTKKNESRMMCGERGNSEKILSSRWEKKTKQNKKQKQKGRAPLLGLAKFIYCLILIKEWPW